MATSLLPFGLRPVKNIAGTPYTGAFRKYKIASNETTPIYNGDPVVVIRTSTNIGNLQRMNTTVAATTVTSSATTSGWAGVLVGCEYTDPNSKKPVITSHYPGAIVASDIYGYVCDDPDMLFMAQADGAISQAKLGCNFAVIQNVVGNTVTKNSGLAVQASSFEETATLPLQLVEFYIDPNNAVGDTYTMGLYRINVHRWRTLTGTDNA